MDESAAALVLHEALHLGLAGRSCAHLVTEHDWWLEEAATEALTLDLLPAWGRRFTRWPIVERPDWPYAERVWGVRQASTVATGSRTWRDRAARYWRRAFALAAPPARVAMLESAEAMR